MTRSGRLARTPLPRVAMLTRYPVHGRVKTRLAADAGPAEALAAHRELAALTARELAALDVRGLARADVWADGGYPAALRAWLGPTPRYRLQPGGDLGARLREAARAAFAAGAPSWVCVGSDCPGATAQRLLAALHVLEGPGGADVVLGPARDGGYWLVGLAGHAARVALPALFDDKPWSDPSLLAETVASLDRAGVGIALADTLQDVDDGDSLAEWRAQSAGESRGLSVVIPTLDEAREIGHAITSAWNAGADEVVVADGGSSDGTPELAGAHGARVLRLAAAQRALQMNAGAAAARGGRLIFLHADTRLPADAATAVDEVLGEVSDSGGAFDFAVHGGGAKGRVVGGLGRIRARVTGLPYGDQALFTSRRTFLALGGFPEQPTMEDWEFARRLRALGTLVIVPSPAATSYRTWARHGVVLPTAVNAAVIAGYRLGAGPRTLQALRARIRAR